MAAPTYIQTAQTTNYSGITPSIKTTTSFPVQTGDLLIAYGIVEDGLSGLPALAVSGGGLTWTSVVQAWIFSSFPYVEIWQATATSNTSITVTFDAAADNGTYAWGGAVVTFRGSSGVGVSGFDNTTGTPDLDLTTQAANSAFLFASGDWNVTSGASRDWIQVNGLEPTETTYSLVASRMTAYGAVYTDTGSAGLKTFGLSAPTGQKWTAAGVEIKGSAGPSDPIMTVELWENGLFKQSLGQATINAEGNYSFTWDAAILTALSGANVELRVSSDSDIDIGAIEWNLVETSPPPPLIERWGFLVM